jgi:PRC-barrel domain
MTMETERRETGTLIGSDKVEGTAVYGTYAQKIGSIERVMIDKVSGQVSYAVLGFCGFLGIGDDHYPLPGIVIVYCSRSSWVVPIPGIVVAILRRTLEPVGGAHPEFLPSISRPITRRLAFGTTRSPRLICSFALSA